MKLSSYDVAKDPFVGNRNFQAFGEFESTHEFEVVGEYDGKEIIRNDFGRTVAVVPYIFNRTSILLARMVFRGRKVIEKCPFFN